MVTVLSLRYAPHFEVTTAFFGWSCKDMANITATNTVTMAKSRKFFRLRPDAVFALFSLGVILDVLNNFFSHVYFSYLFWRF